MRIHEINKEEWIGSSGSGNKPVVYKAGAFSAELLDGRLLNIHVYGKKVIDEIYFALRDFNWKTIPYRIEHMESNVSDNGFVVQFDAIHDSKDIKYHWKGEIKGTADSVISFGFAGEADSSFLSNRIGFCVLHPATCANMECEVEHYSGEIEKGTFPARISPHQPFVDIKAITQFISDSEAVRIEFQGDIFEMEDQRNWTDASYKTYCTPLYLPFPVQTQMGSKCAQNITVSYKSSGEAANKAAIAQEMCAEDVACACRPIDIGSCISAPLTDKQLQRIELLELSHVRYDYYCDENNDKFDEIIAQIVRMGSKALIALFFTRDWKQQLNEVYDKLLANEDSLAGILVYEKNAKVIEQEVFNEIRSKLLDIGCVIGSGTDAFFTQINRDPMDPEKMEFVAYSNNPQVHAFDNASIMATTQGQIANLKSCAQMYPELPIWVTPITMKMRWNPDATGTEVRAVGEAPRHVDNRQMSLFAAAWLIKSIAACIEGGAAGATYLEATGTCGLMEEDVLTRDYHFPAEEGMLYPVYYALLMVRGICSVDSVCASSNTEVATIFIENKDTKRIVIANTSDTPVIYEMPFEVNGGRAFMLDETNVAERASVGIPEIDDIYTSFEGCRSIRLNPYAVFALEYLKKK